VIDRQGGLTEMPRNVDDALHLLEVQYQAFSAALPYAIATGHTAPSDTKSWSQILVSTLTGIKGLQRKKGQDLVDGSDVKGANLWNAIDTPRFNGCIPAGRKSKTSRKPADVSALNACPFLFFVLWDEMGSRKLPRCRIWVVRSNCDSVFRSVCAKWYAQALKSEIKSHNFQLHPPRNRDDDIVKNKCGNMKLPLYFTAVRRNNRFVATQYHPEVLKVGECELA
jgi:hypothetical protein